jgi:hypothetical protein
MDQLLSLLKSDAAGSGRMLGFIVVVAVIFLFTALAMLPFRNRRRPGATFTFNVGPAPMPGQFVQSTQIISGNVSPEMQQQILNGLGTSRPQPSSMRVAKLCFVLAAATAAVVYVYLTLPDDRTSRQLVFYLSIVYVGVVLSVLSQLIRGFRALPGAGTGQVPGLGRNVSMTIRSSSDVHTVDQQALARARQHLDQGGSMDEACSLLDPQYPTMSPILQQAFQKGAELALAQYRRIKQ